MNYIKMKYIWEVTFVYKNGLKELIGLHDIRIDLQSSIKVLHATANKALSILKRKYYGANCQFSISVGNSIRWGDESQFNKIFISGIFLQYSDEEIINDVINIIKNLKEDEYIKLQYDKLKLLKNKKGKGEF